jgi:hypothetical protein
LGERQQEDQDPRPVKGKKKDLETSSQQKKILVWWCTLVIPAMVRIVGSRVQSAMG